MGTELGNLCSLLCIFILHVSILTHATPSPPLLTFGARHSHGCGRLYACSPTGGTQCPPFAVHVTVINTTTTTIMPGNPDCLTCPEHSGTDGTASTFIDCKCEAGYTQGGYMESFCVACPAETYKADSSMNRCTPCPKHISASATATALANCTCLAGLEKTSPTTCEPCGADSYCAGADDKHACPGNSTSPEGSAGIKACTCLPGFFWYHETCEQCGEDHFCVNNTRSARPPNSSAPVANVSVDNCTCIPGFH
jgi:hypothetical protein